MSAQRAQSRRRGRGIGLSGLLVERDSELSTLQKRLREARKGAGSVIFIDAPAGNGKSRLLTIAGDLARGTGMQVLGAQGAELERDFPFGVAIQLFEPRFVAADATTQERLLDGPARWAGELLTGSTGTPGRFPDDRGYAVIHGLFWIARNLAGPSDAAERPALVMLVDDAHWADPPSLRFLAYLAGRVGELPIVLVVAARYGEAASDRRALTALRNAARDAVLAPRSLTETGVTAIVRSEFPEAEPAFCRTCYRTTNGNPFLLVELIAQLRANGSPPDDVTAASLADLAPESVLNSIVRRLEAMPAELRQVAVAVAVLGDGAPLRHVAALARLDLETASHAADRLAAVQLLHPGAPLSFVHPLLRGAVKASISPFERARAHRHAAEILAADGAPEEQTAIQLLEASPEEDPNAVEVLRAASRTALARGAADSAVRMLERALSERQPDDTDPQLLAELAEAELAAGLPEKAIPRLEMAIEGTDDSPRRAELALTRADALHEQARYEEAAAALATVLEHATPEQTDELEAAYVASASMVAGLADDARARGERIMSGLGACPSDRQRIALTHLAMDRGLRGEDRTSVVALTNLAFGNGALLDGENYGRPTWPLLTGALVFVDELERSLEICDAAVPAPLAQDSDATVVIASYCRAWPLYLQAKIDHALTHARVALDANPNDWQAYMRSAYGAIASCQVQRGQLGLAEKALSVLSHPEVSESIHGPLLLDVRAQLRLAQLRPEEALADATEAGRRLQSEFGLDSPGVITWRSTAALAHIALGDDRSARRLAHEELEQARETKIVRVVLRDLRVLGMAEQGQRSLGLLGEAVAMGADYPLRLEYINALIDFGAALRRANRRIDAREPLRKGLELSHRGGADALAALARTELLAAGARPRREMLSGVESLTPSELRVAQLASARLTTRQIAEALFVSPKTVEFHLRGAYRKLGLNSRGELAEALTAGLARQAA